MHSLIRSSPGLTPPATTHPSFVKKISDSSPTLPFPHLHRRRRRPPSIHSPAPPPRSFLATGHGNQKQERGLLLHATRPSLSGGTGHLPPPADLSLASFAGLREQSSTSDGGGVKHIVRCKHGAKHDVQSCDPSMTGNNAAHRLRRFIRHLQMKRALGIKSSCRMWPARPVPGRDHRRGTWWDLRLNCNAIEGKDFAQDTEEGGASQFVLILDSDEEGGAKGSPLHGDDDEYVPETEPQDVTVSKITGPCANQGRQRLGTMFREWRRIISDVENESGSVDVESAKVQMDGVKLEKGSDKVDMESDKLDMCAKVQMDTVKLDKESVKVKMDTVKLESAKVEVDSVKMQMVNGKELDLQASFSDIENDEETCWFQDGVDLRGHSQVEDDDFNDQGLLIVIVIRVGQLLFVKCDVNSICVHAQVMYDIIQGYHVLPVADVNQKNGRHCHLVQKQADRYKNGLSPTHQGGHQSGQIPQLLLQPLHLPNLKDSCSDLAHPLVSPLVSCLSLMLPWGDG